MKKKNLNIRISIKGNSVNRNFKSLTVNYNEVSLKFAIPKNKRIPFNS